MYRSSVAWNFVLMCFMIIQRFMYQKYESLLMLDENTYRRENNAVIEMT